MESGVTARIGRSLQCCSRAKQPGSIFAMHTSSDGKKPPAFRQQRCPPTIWSSFGAALERTEDVVRMRLSFIMGFDRSDNLSRPSLLIFGFIDCGVNYSNFPLHYCRSTAQVNEMCLSVRGPSHNNVCKACMMQELSVVVVIHS